MNPTLWNVRLQPGNGGTVDIQVTAINRHDAINIAEKQTGFKAIRAARA